MNLRAMGAVGEVSWETPGKCGSALEFYSVGTDPQTLQTPAIAFGNAVTLSVWVFVHTSGATTSANGGRNFTSNQESTIALSSLRWIACDSSARLRADHQLQLECAA